MTPQFSLREATVLQYLLPVLAFVTIQHVNAQGRSPTRHGQGVVHTLFDLSKPTGGPFPSDISTLTEPGNNTGLRVNLPKPDCAARPSDCEDIDVLNELDGFNLQPRLSIPFDGPIDVSSVSSRTVFILRIRDMRARQNRDRRVIGINQIVWDVPTNTLHVKSDEQLDQHTRYALVVTRGLRSAAGEPVQASDSFRRFPLTPKSGYAHSLGLKKYRSALIEALSVARKAGFKQRDLVAVSVFTTQSATALLEKIRDQIKSSNSSPADLKLSPDGSRSVFPLSEVKDIIWNQQTGDGPPRFTATQLNLAVLRFVPGVVGQVAFGKYQSPDYMVHPGEFIPPVATRTGNPAVRGTAEVYFNLYLPAGPRPATGWPVAIYGHGTAQSKNTSLAVVATMANRGMAVITINAVGNGFGPLGTLTIQRGNGDRVTIPAGGRGFDQNRDGQIANTEGSHAAPPRILQLNRDGLVQTIADLMQLVRVIQAGIDVDGDGTADVDRSRIYYFGFSQGGNNGIVLVAAEPDIRAAVFNVPGAPLVENRRLSASRSEGMVNASTAPAILFAARRPPLINSPGVTHLDGLSVAPPYFNENLPPRDGVPLPVRLTNGTAAEIRSPVINTSIGAMDIQQWFDRAAWAAQAYNPVAFAPHLRRKPLPGMPVRPVLFQFARGDQASVNPNNTTILRAGNLADRATLFRNDLAFAEHPSMPKNPHGFMANGNLITGGDPFVIAILRGAQEQIATFFATDGKVTIHPEPARFFEVPIAGPLPEGLNFVQ